MACALVVLAVGCSSAQDAAPPLSPTRPTAKPAVVAPSVDPNKNLPTTANWLLQVRADDQKKVAEGQKIAKVRAKQQQAETETAKRPAWWLLALPALPVLGIVISVTWLWINYQKRKQLNRKGLAVELAPGGIKSTTILLHRPDRKPSTRIVRDKAREREVIAAAASFSNEFDAVDPEQASRITKRIVSKHKGTTKRYVNDDLAGAEET